VFKVFLPLVWIGGFGIGTLLMWVVPAEHPEDVPVLEFTVAWIVGSVLLIWLARRLKAVWLDGEWLWVSNLRRRVPISLHDVELVEEVRWLNIHPIILYLRRKTELGDRIAFIPSSLGMPFASHPLVKELRRLADEAAARSTSESGAVRGPGG
jgi:hypothetical protein